ncbi:MAG: hypothetical protein JRJ56_00915 [Deltaproteobacteria bacterium]|jgi:hypothetical protein|nr:hypothetical protein [Deltaproteobacteria bacterium]
MTDPLQQLLAAYGFAPGEIRRLVAGGRYCAVQLADGQLGVCATLGNLVPAKPAELEPLDLGNLGHRIVLNAYFNARLNHRAPAGDHRDITEAVDFTTARAPVMIGLFRPVVARLAAMGVKPAVFDPRHPLTASPFLVPVDRQEEYLRRADKVIISATTIFNRTFTELAAAAGPEAEIYLLGPSTPLAAELFAAPRLQALFGVVFQPDDRRVLEAVAAGRGTRSFIRFARKTVRYRETGGGQA